MLLFIKRLRKFMQKWPGKKTFGVYRFLPLFFVCGALLEFSMINWQVGQVNFYKVYKKRIVQEMVEEKIRKMEGEQF
ncbi:small integral membrane protein 4 [Vespa velutina]|uniref:small integral membrane protein 4 n=1 Tax=Vespa velutina TaxID=202808 RepID=UPI001FB246E5|nr:small integral membrane protein 4 [Vespa velutina]